jgi:hypothetical protein
MLRSIDCRRRRPSPLKGFGKPWTILCALLTLVPAVSGCGGSSWKLTPFL